MSQKIKVTFPNRLSTDQIEYLYSEYESQFPDELTNWQEIERTDTDGSSDEFRMITEHVFKFLTEYCNCDSTRARAAVWMDLRKRVRTK
jgi:hypothetical protein